MDLIDARKQACQEFGFVFEVVFRRGRPSDDVISAKKKMDDRIQELLKETIPGKVLRDVMVDIVKTGGSSKSKEIVQKVRRIAETSTTPLHNCVIDVNVATVSMSKLAENIPKSLLLKVR